MRATVFKRGALTKQVYDKLQSILTNTPADPLHAHLRAETERVMNKLMCALSQLLFLC